MGVEGLTVGVYGDGEGGEGKRMVEGFEAVVVSSNRKPPLFRGHKISPEKGVFGIRTLRNIQQSVR